MKVVAAAVPQNEDEEIFRVSDQASKVPAVAILINVIAGALSQNKEVRSCQGTDKEGHLFQPLSADVQNQNRSVTATSRLSRTSLHPIVELLRNELPREPVDGISQPSLVASTPQLLKTFANLMDYTSTHS